MAKINKQEVIQKLIDELNLYPGKDLIPSELADKILAVYQINAGEVSIKNPTATVVKSLNKWPFHSTPGVIYTVPATGKFYLTNAWMVAAVDTDLDWVMNITINSVEVALLSGTSEPTTDALGPNPSISLNLQNPILLDPGSTIELVGDQEYGGCFIDAGIVGYTEDI